METKTIVLSEEDVSAGSRWLSARKAELGSRLHVLPASGDLLAVYGTLRSRCHNNWLLHGAVYVGKAKTVDAYPLHDICLLPFPGHGLRVECELWKPTAHHWRNIDILEGHPFGYVRIPTQVTALSSGDQVAAWMYFYPRLESSIVRCVSSSRA